MSATNIVLSEAARNSIASGFNTLANAVKVTLGPRGAIERATRVQLKLVDDLLDVSKIIAGKLSVELRPVDLRAVLEAAIEGVRVSAHSKLIQLDVTLDESSGSVVGDSVRLQQVCSNLLTNAIKFTPEHGRGAVTLASTDGCARIQVSDTGTGIDPSFLPHVFSRFAQADTSNTRLHGGLGLGLAIARSLVIQHGGTLEGESPGLGKGSTFSVTLPLAEIRPEPMEDETTVTLAGLRDTRSLDHQQLKDLSILVIDDDLGTRETVAELLKGMGAEVQVAKSSAEALIAVQELRPKVVMCDIAMPGEDGYTFIRKLRALTRDAGGETPVLAVTTLVGDGDHQRSLAAGFQMHLTKPIDFARLAEAVIQLAERRYPNLRLIHLD